MTKSWRDWAASPAADHPTPVGRKRLEVARFGAVLAETFAEAKADVTGGYHAFRYDSRTGECDQAGRCSVATYPVEVSDGAVHVTVG